MLGRRSATSLLSLGGPSSGNLDNPDTAAARSAMQTATRLPELLQRSRSAAAAAAALGVPPPPEASLAAEVAKANPGSNILKRSGTEADLVNGVGDARKKQRRKEGGDEADDAEGDATSVQDSVANEGPTEIISPLSPNPSG